MLNLARPIDTSDPLLMSDEERAAFLTPQYRVMHRHLTPKGKYRGVNEDNGRFIARISSRGVCYYLGSFDTAEEAAYVYDARARMLHKEWAMLNFPEVTA